MQIQSNSFALKAIQAMHSANQDMAIAAERISTGLRINRAADDPAGLMVAHRIQTDIVSAARANMAVNDGLGVTQVVDKALSSMTDVLNSMLELTQSPNSMSIAQYSSAMTDYLDELESIQSSASYNGQALMSFSGSTQDFSLGSGSFAPKKLTLTHTDLTWMGLNSPDIKDRSKSGTATSDSMLSILNAIDKVSEYQARVGAMTNVLTHHQSYLDDLGVEYKKSSAQIMTADVATEAANVASAQIRRDGATAMLAQAHGMNKEIVAYLLKSVS